MQPEESTKVLLSQIAQNDEKAFKSLFDLYRSRLYGYIFRMIKSKEVAEELVMDVFMKIWLGRALLTKIDHFDGFLFRVAYNKSIDFLRSAARDPVLHQLVWENICVAENGTAEDSLAMEEYNNKLREALALLSPQRRLVFNLSRNEELSHEQIAVRLHLSKHTINNHITEAKHFIRKYLIDSLDIAVPLLFLLLL